MADIQVNHLAVLVCAVMSLVIGGLWWSPALFARPWQKEVGLTDEDMADFKPLRTFGLTFVLAYVVSYNLAFFTGAEGTSWQWTLTAALLAAVWPVAMFVLIGLFERRTARHLLIDSGYIVVYFAVIGLILGLWR